MTRLENMTWNYYYYVTAIIKQIYFCFISFLLIVISLLLRYKSYARFENTNKIYCYVTFIIKQIYCCLIKLVFKM